MSGAKFILLISILICSSLVINSTNIEVRNITDSNFDQEVNDGRTNSWLVMFYLNTCPHCKVAKEGLYKIAKNEELTSEDKVRIGKVECSANVMSCMRFNVTRVPYIVLIEDQKLFELNTYATEHTMLKLITEEKLLDSAKEIPDSLGYVGLFFKILKEAVMLLNEYIEEFVSNKMNMKIQWDTNYTIALLVVFLITMIFIEYLIVVYCCKRSHKQPKKTNKIEESKEEVKDANTTESDKQEVTADKPKTD